MTGILHRKIFIGILVILLFLSACGSHMSRDGATVQDTVKQGYAETDTGETEPKGSDIETPEPHLDDGEAPAVFYEFGPPPEPTRQGFEEYAAILLEDAAFFDATVQEYRHLSNYMPPLFRHRLLSTSDFCLSDIDNDGTEEVFLQYDSLDSYLVFDYEDGTVYGYCFHQPELQSLEFCLKIHKSVGPYINLWPDETCCKILFSHGEYELIPIPEPDSANSEYAVWHAFTKENLLEVFRPDELDAYLAEQEALATEWTKGWKEKGEAWEAFLRVLNGDFSLIADVETRYRLASCYWEDIKEFGACSWKYVLLEDKFGRQSLFIQSGEVYDSDFSALLYYDDGELICAVLDIGDYHDFYVPLRDGKLLYIYGYYNTTEEFIIQIDTDFEYVWETEYETIRIYYEMYEECDDPNSQYRHFAEHYDVISGIGEYYFVTESNFFTYPKEVISQKERWEIEELFDEWIVPDGAWRTCPEKTDAVLLNLEELFVERTDHRYRDIVDSFYADFERDGKASAFAFNGSIYHDPDKSYSWPFMGFSGSVWYVDAEGCTLLEEEIRTDGYEPTIISYQDECHLLYTANYKDGHYLGCVFSYVWAVRDGKPTLLFETPGFCRVEDGKLVCTDTIEAAVEEDDTTEKRCFYWDAASGTYKEEN
ncbi:MAG: hypothetical protein HDQ99_00180 [Lachnospiraceae bacterium]|nr:hypothetical protein [Lachnospiraceae bacterium]